jgi:mlo protein
MAAGGYGERSLKETPSWAAALVCAVFVVISIVIERGIHSLEKVIRNFFLGKYK